MNLSSSSAGSSLGTQRARLSRPGRPCAALSRNTSGPSAHISSHGPGSHATAAAAAAAARQAARQRLVIAASGSGRFPNQADSLFNPTDREDITIGLAERVATRSVSDLDYLSVRAEKGSGGLVRGLRVGWDGCEGVLSTGRVRVEGGVPFRCVFVVGSLTLLEFL